MSEITWEDIRGLYLHLSTAAKEVFINYLRGMQDSGDNSEPPSCEP